MVEIRLAPWRQVYVDADALQGLSPITIDTLITVMKDSTRGKDAPGRGIMTIPVPTLTLTTRRSALEQNCETELDVLVQVTPPECPPETRENRVPLHLALVIDRAGSISGRPIAEPRSAAARVINGWLDEDRAASVVYDDNVQTLMPLSDMTRRQRLLHVIRTV